MSFDQIDGVASRQHGLLSRDQAVALLGEDRVRRWLRAQRLLVDQPGVYRLMGATRTWHQGLMAAVLSCDGVVSHRAAAELWGLVDPVQTIEVSARPERHPRLRPPAIAHRIKDLRPHLAVRRCGLPVTDPQRTLVDLGLVLPSRAVSDALTKALTTRLVSIESAVALRDALGRPGRNGAGVLRQVLEDRGATATKEESVLEARFVDLLARHGLELPTLQLEVWAGGRFVARLDAAYEDVLLAIELDGFGSHTTRDAFQRDRSRQNQLVDLGWTLLRFTWHDVVHDGPRVLQTILRTRRRLRLCTENGA